MDTVNQWATMENAPRVQIALPISIARWANVLTTRKLVTHASIAMSAAGQLLASIRMELPSQECAPNTCCLRIMQYKMCP